MGDTGMDGRGTMTIIGNDNRVVLRDLYEVRLSGEAARSVAERILALLDRGAVTLDDDGTAISIYVNINRG